MDRLSERDWLTLARDVLDTEIQGLGAVRDQLDGGFLAALELMVACTGRVVVTGIGKSGLVGRKIAATLSSTGTPAFFLHPVEGAHGDMGMIRAEDVVLAISNSGDTEELNAILPTLRSLGAAVVAMTGNPDSTMGRLADAVVRVKVPREACPFDLAPTASTTATLAVGDALAVCLMELKSFDSADFRRVHPGGALGKRLCRPVDELMHVAGLPVAGADMPLGSALAVLDKGRLGLLAVLESGDDAPGGDASRLAGVLTDGDLRRLVCSGTMDLAAPVGTVMTASPRMAVRGQSAAEVLDIMETRQITVLPVVDDEGRLAGMVHLHDLLGKGNLKFAGECPDECRADISGGDAASEGGGGAGR